MLKVMTEEKEKTRENKKPRVFLKKGFGGGGKGKKNRTFLELPETLCSVALKTTPL